MKNINCERHTQTGEHIPCSMVSLAHEIIFPLRRLKFDSKSLSPQSSLHASSLSRTSSSDPFEAYIISPVIGSSISFSKIRKFNIYMLTRTVDDRCMYITRRLCLRKLLLFHSAHRTHIHARHSTLATRHTINTNI